MYPWYYNPLVLPTSTHPITKNLDLIRFEFCNNIDTLSTVGLKKTVLLSSSKYSRLQNTPARVTLAMASMKPNEKIFNQSNLNLAVLIEGNFKSIYKNRLANQIANDSAIQFQTEGKKSAMIVISDGDIIRNRFNKNNLNFYQLGYDRYMRQIFANKTFLLNCVNYLCDGEELLSIRSREVKLRLLDKKRIKSSHLKWQLINTVVPIAVIVLAGITLSAWRKKRYTK
jgi:ABC-2 type transport system permease protein